MVSNRKKRQQDRRFLSELDDFDHDIKINDAAKSEQQSVVVNDGTVDRELTVNNRDNISTTKENTVNSQILERKKFGRKD